MKILFVDPNVEVCKQLAIAFAGVREVEVVADRFEPHIGEFDCLVSPANGFGIMDGGVDLAITRYFGPELQRNVQAKIWNLYRGEQPVGTCLMVPTFNDACPWLAHAPTMAVPMSVAGSNHAYAAFLAALMAARDVGVKRMACSGLGTLTGRLPPDVAARQMRFAYHLANERVAPRVDWYYADARRRSSLGEIGVADPRGYGGDYPQV